MADNFSNYAGEFAAESARVHWRKKFPYKSRYKHSPEELKKIGNKFAIWYIVVMFLTLIVGGIELSFTGPILHHIYTELFYRFHENDRLTVLLSESTFYLPAAFVTLTTVILPVELIQMLLMGKMYPVYNDYYNTTKGYDNKKAGRQYLMVMGGTTIIILFQFFTAHMTVKDSEFQIKHMYTLYSGAYQLTDVDKIHFIDTHHYADSNETATPYFELWMKDGDHFSTNNWPENDDSIRKFMTALSARSVPIDSGTGATRNE